MAVPSLLGFSCLHGGAPRLHLALLLIAGAPGATTRFAPAHSPAVSSGAATTLFGICGTIACQRRAEVAESCALADSGSWELSYNATRRVGLLRCPNVLCSANAAQTASTSRSALANESAGGSRHARCSRTCLPSVRSRLKTCAWLKTCSNSSSPNY